MSLINFFFKSVFLTAAIWLSAVMFLTLGCAHVRLSPLDDQNAIVSFHLEHQPEEKYSNAKIKMKQYCGEDRVPVIVARQNQIINSGSFLFIQYTEDWVHLSFVCVSPKKTEVTPVIDLEQNEPGKTAN